MLFEPVNGRTSLTNPPTLVTRAGLKHPGASTSAAVPQSPFALEIWDEYNQDRKVEFLGMPEESDWVLYGQDPFDTSYLHNPLIHQLTGCRRYSSRTRFAEMFLTPPAARSLSAPPAAITLASTPLRRRSSAIPTVWTLPSWNAEHHRPNVTGVTCSRFDRAASDERTFTILPAKQHRVPGPKGLKSWTRPGRRNTATSSITSTIRRGARERPVYNPLTGYPPGLTSAPGLTITSSTRSSIMWMPSG